MFVIGIDVSKYKHDCIVLNDAGDVVIKQFTVANDRSGFNQLLSVINKLDPSQEKRIGFESTGHYQGNLEAFLENAGMPFMELNALLVHPLVGDWEKAQRCFEEMKQAHKAYLPQFFKEEA